MADEHALTVLAAALHKDHDAADHYPGLIHIRTEYFDRSRWAITFLDVYLHGATGTYAGVLFREPATEMQEQDPDPTVVAVEPDPTPHFRIRKETPR